MLLQMCNNYYKFVMVFRRVQKGVMVQRNYGALWYGVLCSQALITLAFPIFEPSICHVSRCYVIVLTNKYWSLQSIAWSIGCEYL